ncbi:MAG: peptide chain release factor N(5)-glutamine methyltransferase [Leptothrix sp. (in: Bacteria)]|nr:peptide chain release factor N(5)-glutamine methyltransferase [Leptothrix sp. (in: b-proteobacteria)]
MTITEALQAARALGVARLDAQWLLEHLLARPRTWLLAHDDCELTPAQAAQIRSLLARRAAGQPLAYLVGEREFRGLALQVSPAVLVPRPETELLVEWALECLPAKAEADVVDLGCGSGAIALAVQRERPLARVTASDASAEALAVARANALRHGLAVLFVQGDWWAPLRGRRFALALCNPPYVAGDDPHLAALAHEPRGALTPEGDGLAALRCVVQGAPAHLLPGACLLLEHGHDQAAAVQQMLLGAGFATPETRHDLAGLARCTGARWPGAK